MLRYASPETTLNSIALLYDFDFIRRTFFSPKKNPRGRPPLDPVFYFKAHIVKFLFKVRSYRQLICQLNTNHQLRKFCGIDEYQIPHHTWFSKFHKRVDPSKMAAILIT